MIEINDVSLSFDGFSVLRNINLTLSEQRIAIVGSNGSGKSSFARLLNGLQLPTEGKVVVDGFDTKRDGKQVRKKVGFVFQNPDNQIVFPVVDEDLAFGLGRVPINPAT
ncbi:ATP-binding cassette domain-containing protein [Bradyrhizobium sp. BR 10261]|nr:ATP-binding cassette domain-containing protein [Bradyrhizobium sp. BR 10261]